MISPLWCDQPEYDGYYAGTYSGDDNGIWIALVNSSSDSLIMIYSTDSDDLDLGFLIWGGEIGGIGNYYIDSTEIFGSSFDADIDSLDDSVLGDWSNSFSGYSGWLEGSLVTSVAFEGDYSGTYRGEESGTWSVTIASDGSIIGSFTATSNNGFGDLVGVCHPDGYVLIVGVDSISGMGIVMLGEITGSDVSGSWESETGDSGTFSTGSGGGGGGGGGGGCFINALKN